MPSFQIDVLMTTPAFKGHCYRVYHFSSSIETHPSLCLETN